MIAVLSASDAKSKQVPISLYALSCRLLFYPSFLIVTIAALD